MTRRLIALMMLALSLSLTSCGEDSDDPPPPDTYLPQTSEDNVLENFERAYVRRDIAGYTRLLASDFQFYFDPVTRDRLGGIEFWTRTQDSLRTEALFTAPEVTKIVVDLEWPRGSAVNVAVPPRDPVTKIFVTDVFLDVDFAPIGQEVTTYRVENQTQRFFFRRGRTNPPSGPADTLVYLVEWRDQGVSGGGSALTQSPATWSGIKNIFE